MIHAVGFYKDAGTDLQGNTTLTLVVNNTELVELEKLKNKDLIVDIKHFSPKRSLNANAYFWVLCDMIAKTLGSDKDTIYLMQLGKYGVFVDIEIHKDAISTLKEKFRYVEEFTDGYNTDFVIARCYFGSSQYTKKEMSDLITGTKQDAIELGLTVWTDEEIDRLVEAWER